MHFKNILLAAVASVASVHAWTIIEVLGNNPDLSTLSSLLSKYQDVVDAISQLKEFTVVAPNNDAFTKFLSDNPGADQDDELVKAVLKYHVLQGIFKEADIRGAPGPSFPVSLLDDAKYSIVSGGQVVKGAVEGDEVVFTSGLLKKSTVVKADVAAENGVVHIVDAVLTIPKTVSETATELKLTKLVENLKVANLVDSLDTTPELTILGPNDDAFNAVSSVINGLNHDDLVKVLTYHVIGRNVLVSPLLDEGQSYPTLDDGAVVEVHKDDKGAITFNDAPVLIADVLVSVGIVHVIDKVLTPPSAGAPNGGGGGSCPEEEKKQ